MTFDLDIFARRHLAKARSTGSEFTVQRERRKMLLKWKLQPQVTAF